MRPRVVFVHGGPRAYRNRLFTLLSERLDIRFLFYVGKKQSGKFRKEWQEESRKWRYEILTPIRNLGYSYLAPSVLWKVWDSDVIITSDLSSFPTHALYAATRIRKRPFIVWGENWEWPETRAARFILPYVRRIMRNCDACIAAGSKAREFFISLGASPDKVFIAPNAAERLPDPERKDMQAIRQKAKGKRMVLYLARIVRYKGLDVLLHAMMNLDPEKYRLVVAGTGPFEEECKALAKTLGLDVEWVGAVPHENVCAYYDACDVYVLPSVFRKQDVVSSEAWGLSINEALGRHIPVVSTTAVAAAFDLIVNGKNGFLVPQQDPTALAEAIKHALGLDKKIVRMTSEHSLKKHSYLRQANGFTAAVDFVTKER